MLLKDTFKRLEKINYWNFGESVDSERSNNGPEPEFTPQEKLFICLARLRRGFTLKTLAALLSSPNKKNYFTRPKSSLRFLLCFKPLHFNHLERTIKRYHINLKANSSILKIRLTSEFRIVLPGKDRDPLISTVERDCLERHLFLTKSPSWKQSQNYNHETRTRADLASNIVE